MPEAPRLMEENEEVWDLYRSVNTQWRVSMAGLVGLDYTAVYRVAETMEIEITPALLRKLRILESVATSKKDKE